MTSKVIWIVAAILRASAAGSDLERRRSPNAIRLVLAAFGLARLAMTAPGLQTALPELAFALALLGAVSVLLQRGYIIGGGVKSGLSGTGGPRSGL